MTSLNTVQIIGNLGQDPELKTTDKGTAIVNLSVATNETFTDGEGNRKTSTEWHRIVVVGRQAETCAEHLEKGRRILVEGRLRTRSWKDKDGIERWTTEIVARRVQFLGGSTKAA